MPNIVATIPIGDNPNGICTDGSYIYAGSNVTASIYKIDPATNLSILNFPTTDSPVSVACDGTNIWSISNTTVRKFSNTGGVLGTASSPANKTLIRPLFFAFSSIWCPGTPNLPAGHSIIARIDLATFVVTSIDIGTDGTNVWGSFAITSDGTFIWVSATSSIGNTKLFKIDPGSNTISTSYTNRPGDYSDYDTGNARIWTDAISGVNTLRRIVPGTGAYDIQVNDHGGGGVLYETLTPGIWSIGNGTANRFNPTNGVFDTTVAGMNTNNFLGVFAFNSLWITSGSGANLVYRIGNINTPPPTFTGPLVPATGPSTGGTSVTVNGTGFEVGVSVTIGGVPCAVTSFSSTVLTIKTPANIHTGTALPIVITNPDFGTVTGASAFTYTNVTPVVSTITPQAGSTSGGTPVLIMGSGFSFGATISFAPLSGTNATAVSVIDSNNISCSTPAALTINTIGLTNVTVTNPGALVGTLPNSFTYVTSPPVFQTAGNFLMFDFNRDSWQLVTGGPGTATAQYADFAVDYSQGPPHIYGIGRADGTVYEIMNEQFPSNQSQGFLQTFPIFFGNHKTLKKFNYVRILVNDITVTWTCFVFIDNSPTPISLTFEVNPNPYNLLPLGSIDGPNYGELIANCLDINGGPLMGHSLTVEIYYPTGTPVNTPIVAGFKSPWSIDQIDISANLSSEGKDEM